MEVLAALIGAGIVAASPFVPILRPVAKAAVKGGLAVSEAAVGVASTVGQQVNEAVGKGKAEAGTGAEGAEATPTTEETEEVSQKAGLGSLAAALRPTAESAAKVGAVVTEKAKGAAVSAGKHWSDLVAEARESQQAQAEKPTDVPVSEVKKEIVVETPVETTPAPAEDDLSKIRGIGPKSATLLNKAGITTYAQLAATDEAQLRQILDDGGGNYRFINPTDWPEQARQLVEAA
jgi:predicted flap endonuclease-1-like 5' DNA nuclease